VNFPHRRARPSQNSNSAPYGIEVEGLSKAFRGRSVLSNIELLVPRGSIAVVEGDNGAGKTTLLRILATVVSPDGGTARVDGFDVRSQSLDVRRSIGVGFANERSLYWRINGFENLELFGKIVGLSRAVIQRRSSRLLEALEMTEVASGRVAQMSTGQRQRLMIARALLTNPKVLLLDEPLRGLDEDGLRAFFGLMTTSSDGGLTSLITAPIVDEVLSIASAAYRLEKGTLQTMPSTKAVETKESRP